MIAAHSTMCSAATTLPIRTWISEARPDCGGQRRAIAECVLRPTGGAGLAGDDGREPVLDLLARGIERAELAAQILLQRAVLRVLECRLEAGVHCGAVAREHAFVHGELDLRRERG